jgi:hypothetical protein
LVVKEGGCALRSALGSVDSAGLGTAGVLLAGHALEDVREEERLGRPLAREASDGRPRRAALGKVGDEHGEATEGKPAPPELREIELVVALEVRLDSALVLAE